MLLSFSISFIGASKRSFFFSFFLIGMGYTKYSDPPWACKLASVCIYELFLLKTTTLPVIWYMKLLVFNSYWLTCGIYMSLTAVTWNVLLSGPPCDEGYRCVFDGVKGWMSVIVWVFSTLISSWRFDLHLFTGSNLTTAFFPFLFTFTLQLCCSHLLLLCRS